MTASHHPHARIRALSFVLSILGLLSFFPQRGDTSPLKPTIRAPYRLVVHCTLPIGQVPRAFPKPGSVISFKALEIFLKRRNLLPATQIKRRPSPSEGDRERTLARFFIKRVVPYCAQFGGKETPTPTTTLPAPLPSRTPTVGGTYSPPSPPTTPTATFTVPPMPSSTSTPIPSPSSTATSIPTITPVTPTPTPPVTPTWPSEAPLVSVPITCNNPAIFSRSGAADEAPRLRSFISTARAQGITCVKLAPGTYPFGSQVHLGGVSNFTLIGSGSDQTFITTLSQIPAVFGVGNKVFVHNNWPLTGRPLFPVEAARTGDRTLKLKTPGPLNTGFFVLFDDRTIRPVRGPDRLYYAAELVRVTSVSTSGEVSLEGSLGREYDQNARLSEVGSLLSQNVAIGGFSVDGTTSGTWSAGAIDASLVHNLRIDDVRVANFAQTGVAVTQSSHVEVSRVDVRNSQSVDAGAGYGIGFFRSRFINVHSSTGGSVRHAVIFHTGSMDGVVHSINSSGNLDLHGFDERRITFRDIVSTDGVAIGNNAWRAGAQWITVERADIRYVHIGNGARDVRVRDSSIDDIRVNASGITHDFPVPLPTGNIFFDNVHGSAFTANTMIAIYGEDPVQGLTFRNCSFENTSPHGSVIKLGGNYDGLNFSGRVTIENSQFTNSRNSIVIAGTFGSPHLTFMRNTFRIAEPTSPTAITHWTGTSGVIRASENLLQSLDGKGAILGGQGSFVVTE